MATVGERTWTAKELADQAPPGLWELDAGRLVEVHATIDEPAYVAGRLHGFVFAFVEPRKLGEVLYAEGGFLLARNPDTVRCPDLAFIADARLPGAYEHGFSTIAPDLVAEVVSPSDRKGAVRAKVAEWLAFGVRLVWVVDPPSRSVTIHHRDGARPTTLAEGDALPGEDVLPGFSLPLADLFRLPGKRG